MPDDMSVQTFDGDRVLVMWRGGGMMHADADLTDRLVTVHPAGCVLMVPVEGNGIPNGIPIWDFKGKWHRVIQLTPQPDEREAAWREYDKKATYPGSCLSRDAFLAGYDAARAVKEATQ